MPKLLGVANVLLVLLVLGLLVKSAPGEGGGATNKVVARSITIVDEKKQVRAFLGLNDEGHPDDGVRLVLFDGDGAPAFTVATGAAGGGTLHMAGPRGKLFLQVFSGDDGTNYGGAVRVGGVTNGSVFTSVLQPGLLFFEKDGKETHRLRPPEDGK